MQLADRITVFNSGKILAEGTPGEIRANTQVQDAYLGATHG
jgi:branched-chain amino acid transport system ATP-binding protein